MIPQTPMHELINYPILHSIPKNAKKICDVGCMAGTLAREYKKINPEVFYIGVDIVPDYANSAKVHCDEVLIGNIETDLDKVTNIHRDIDYWVLGDVIEHLQNPWKFLKDLYDKSSLNSQYIICIPNSQHWTVQYKLILGNLFYEDMGLLDRSHLRFFTRQTFCRYLNEVGFKINQIKILSNSNPLDDADFNLLQNFVRNKGYDSELYLKESTAYQYIYLITK